MKVVCKLCGRQFETLNSHMTRSHGITVNEYLDQFPGSQTCSEEFLRKQSVAMTRRNLSLEFSESVSRRNREKWKDKIYRETQVLSMIKKRNRAIIGTHTSSKCVSFVAYKSSSELEYAKFLDQCEDVLSYDSESFVIWYNHLGQEKMYILDFIVKYRDSHVEVVEIKPSIHHSAHDDLLCDKYRAAQDYCKDHGYTFVTISR